MLAIWKAVKEQFEQGKNFVLATILSVRGSSPRHVGTRFLVKSDGSIVGTIGGGLFEARVQKFAAEALEKGISHRAYFSFTGKDAESTEMICGGDAEVLVEFVEANDPDWLQIYEPLLNITRNRSTGYFFTEVPIPVGGQSSDRIKHLLIDGDGTRLGGFSGDEIIRKFMPESRLLKPAQLMQIPYLPHPVFLEWLRPTGTAYIFGAGHVGACVAHLASYVNFKVVVIEDREEFANPNKLPDADEIHLASSFEKAFEKLSIDEDSYIVIVTRGHRHDKTVLAQALKTNAGYIGMIGSRRKTKLIFQNLLIEGFTREDLQRVHAPIGVPIGGETPEEIGVSIIAEMISLRNKKDRLQQIG